MNAILKKIWPDAAAIVGFLLIAFAYFFTPVTQGLVLTGHDVTGGVGASTELLQHLEETGEITRWTNSVFGGMPTYQMAPDYRTGKILHNASRVYELFTPDLVRYLFALMLGFFILMRAFNFRPLLAALGAILWAFSSYYLILISAGHVWKLLTLAYIPPTIAGIVLCYRGKLLWGGLLTGLFGAFQIMSNHPQMSYYFVFVIVLMVIAYFADALRQKTLPAFFKASAVVLIAGIVAIASNLSNLYHTYEYSKETMRGKPALQLTEQTAASTENNKGLELDYITQWSYGIGETWSLLVPNVKGGGSASIMENAKAMEHERFGELQQHMSQTYQLLQEQAPQMANSIPGLNVYWGDQPMTVGPVYVGAIVCFLFILALLVVRTPMAWALLIATLLSFMMAWGKNFMPFTEFLVNNFPLYDKFRAVASGLVIAEFTMPLLAILGLAEIIRRPESLGKRNRNLLIAFGLTGGVTFLMALSPSLFFGKLLSANEKEIFDILSQAGISVTAYAESLQAIRSSIVSADAWRSFIFIALACAHLMAFRSGKLKGNALVAILTVLSLIDLWGVDKRYLNDTNFVEPMPITAQAPMTEADKEILKDQSLGYRVLNMSTNTFNENETALYHRSIGGYSAVKLRSYQDLIDHALSGEMSALAAKVGEVKGDLSLLSGDSLMPALNMLNTKYIIFPTASGQPIAVANPWAAGAAWFVGDMRYVSSDKDEMLALRQTDTRNAAVANEAYKAALGTATPSDTTGVVKLVKYQPNELHYDVRSDKGGIILFSEVYYPGWTATIDGQATDISRADYLLRALRVTPGHHTIVFTYKPESVKTTELIAIVALLVLMHLFNLPPFIALRKWWKNKKRGTDRQSS